MKIDIYDTDCRYDIVYCDPPWSYRDKKKNRGGAEKHYSTMGLKELAEMPVANIASDDCVLLMWATFPKIQDALDLIKLWGFEYKTAGFVWVKRNKIKRNWFWGMGSWTRANAEVCLIATKGKPKRIGKGVHSVLDSTIMRHSQKPDEARDRIVELMGDIPRIELFARQATAGWSCWGDGLE